MRLEHFQYVVAIAESHSLSKAAKDLFISQPSLSVNVRNLEAELGFAVFERSSHGMVLTRKGERFYQVARRILEELRKVEELTAPENVASEVTLAAVPVYCNAIMLSLLASLQKTAPELVLNVKEMGREAVWEAVLNRQADLAVGIAIDEEQEELYQHAAQKGVIIEPLVVDRMYVYLPQKHPLAQEGSVTLKSLEEYDLILLKDKDATSPAPNHKAAYSYTFSERDSVIKAISKGMGYAILPGLMSLDNIYVETGLVRVVPISDGMISATLYLAYSEKEGLAEGAAVVAEIIRGERGIIKRGLQLLPEPEAGNKIPASTIQY